MEKSLLSKIFVANASDCAYSSITEALIAELPELGTAMIVAITWMRSISHSKEWLEERTQNGCCSKRYLRIL
jgi:hypothetical protein